MVLWGEMARQSEQDISPGSGDPAEVPRLLLYAASIVCSYLTGYNTAGGNAGIAVVWTIAAFTCGTMGLLLFEMAIAGEEPEFWKDPEKAVGNENE